MWGDKYHGGVPTDHYGSAKDIQYAETEWLDANGKPMGNGLRGRTPIAERKNRPVNIFDRFLGRIGKSNLPNWAIVFLATLTWAAMSTLMPSTAGSQPFFESGFPPPNTGSTSAIPITWVTGMVADRSTDMAPIISAHITLMQSLGYTMSVIPPPSTGNPYVVMSTIVVPVGYILSGISPGKRRSPGGWPPTAGNAGPGTIIAPGPGNTIGSSAGTVQLSGISASLYCIQIAGNGYNGGSNAGFAIDCQGQGTHVEWCYYRGGSVATVNVGSGDVDATFLNCKGTQTENLTGSAPNQTATPVMQWIAGSTDGSMVQCEHFFGSTINASADLYLVSCHLNSPGIGAATSSTNPGACLVYSGGNSMSCAMCIFDGGSGNLTCGVARTGAGGIQLNGCTWICNAPGTPSPMCIDAGTGTNLGFNISGGNVTRSGAESWSFILDYSAGVAGAHNIVGLVMQANNTVGSGVTTSAGFFNGGGVGPGNVVGLQAGSVFFNNLTVPTAASAGTAAFAVTNANITTPNGVQNSLGYDALIGGSINVTTATAGQLIQVGIGSSSANAISNLATIIVLPTVSAATPFTIPAFKVPSGWFLCVKSTATTLTASSAALVAVQAD